MIDKLRMMAIFQAVAEAGSFRAAAKRLGLSPSVVSHHVSTFEGQLGLPLLYRSTRRISLTDAGRELLEASQRMTRAAEDGLAGVNRRTEQPSGKLKVALNASTAHPPASDIFVRFAKAYPKVQLQLNFEDRRVPLEGSDFDVAIRGTATGLDDSSYRARKLGQLPLCLFASPTYLSGRPTPREIDELADWDLIELIPVPWKVLVCDAHGHSPVTEPKVAATCNNYAMARNFVDQGLGMMVETLPLVAQAFRSGDLVQILPERPLAQIEVFAVYPANAGEDTLARLLVDFMVEHRWVQALL